MHPSNPSAPVSEHATPARPERHQRVLLLGDMPPPIHGQSVSFQMLCGQLPRRGFDCRVVDIGRKANAPWGRLSLNRVAELSRALARFLVGLGKGYRLVYLLIAQSAPGFGRDAVIIWCAWLCGCRVVAHLRGGNYDGFYADRSAVGKFIIRHTLRRTHRLVVLSERLRHMFAFDRKLDGRVVAVNNSPPLAVDARHRQRRAGEPIKLLYLSNLIQSKGYATVLEAVRILKHEKSLDVRARFAGRFDALDDDCVKMSPLEAQARFARYVEDNGLELNAEHVGTVAGERKWSLIDDSDFFVLPTNYRHEGQPISIIEAMARGCVVIATNYRAIPDLVVDGETGVHVDYGRPEQIADAVARLAADHSAYAATSRAAAQRYRERFTVERHVEALAQVLTAP